MVREPFKLSIGLLQLGVYTLYPKQYGRASNLKEAIIEALTFLGGCGTVSEVRRYIVSKYGNRWKDIGTAMADLCPESKSSTYSLKDRVLKRVGRGKYCLREMKSTDKPTTMKIPRPRKVKVDFFVFRNADKILREKGLLDEIKGILESIQKLDHIEIQNEFLKKGWEVEKYIFPEVAWKWDAYKNKVAVSIEFSLIDAVHRDFLRAILAQKRGELDVLVYVTSTSKEPKFRNVRRDVEIFKEILHVPILLVGLT